MRIDVDLDHRDLERELAQLWARLKARGDPLQQLPIFAPKAPELVFRYREVDGEFHVYAEDTSRDVLAGCTVFGRVFEVDADVGSHVRSPHSRYANNYRRRGVATQVYQWALQAGMCLVSGPRQSPGAHRLWERLARCHEMRFVEVGERRLRLLGASVERDALEAYETRMVLVGAGCNAGRLLVPGGPSGS